jgi:hypothetical protein
LNKINLLSQSQLILPEANKEAVSTLELALVLDLMPMPMD